MIWVIPMKEYNLFVIKKEYYEYYQKNPLFLFDILKKLYYMKEDFNYGISLYSQLCERINIFNLKYYLNKKYKLDNERTFYIEKSFVELKNTRIIIRGINYNNLLEDFKTYSKNIFVCDFINNDYFWLTGKVTLSTIMA